MTTGFRKPGEFCWVNMLSPEPALACEFFGKLLGWTFFEMPGIGFGVKVAGRDVGGIFDTVSQRAPNGTAPIIGVMVKVENADATAARVRELGGRAEEPFDVGPAGRMSVCHDPNGAEFDVWQPGKMLGTDVDSRLPGAPTWFETITTDVQRARTFYEALFGWSAETQSGPGYEYTEFKRGTEFVAGMMQLSPEMADAHMKPHWATYFAVTDVDSTAREAAKLGAVICVPPRDIPGVGSFAGIISPQGVTFYVIKYS